MTINLYIPIEAAATWGIDDLVMAFTAAADKTDGELIDDSETMGDDEWFEFDGMTADELRVLAQTVLAKRRFVKAGIPNVNVEVVSDTEVRVRV